MVFEELKAIFSLDPSKVEAGAARATAAVESSTESMAAGARVATLAVDGLAAAFETLEATLAPLIAITAAVFAVKGIEDFTHHSVEAFKEAQDAVTQLGASLASTGRYSEEAMHKLEENAEALSKVTTKSVIDIEKATAKLSFFAKGLNPEELEKAQQAIVALSDKTGKSMDSVSMMIGRAMNGAGAGLKRLGIEVDKNASQHEKLNQIIKQTASNFEVSKAKADTLSGSMQQLHNNFHETEVKVGEMIVQGLDLTGMFHGLNSIVDVVNKTLDDNRAAIMRVIGTMRELAKLAIESGAAVFHGLSGMLQAFVQIVSDAINALGKALGGIGAAMGTVASHVRNFGGSYTKVDTLDNTGQISKWWTGNPVAKQIAGYDKLAGRQSIMSMATNYFGGSSFKGAGDSFAAAGKDFQDMQKTFAGLSNIKIPAFKGFGGISGDGASYSGGGGKAKKAKKGKADPTGSFNIPDLNNDLNLKDALKTQIPDVNEFITGLPGINSLEDYKFASQKQGYDIFKGTDLGKLDEINKKITNITAAYKAGDLPAKQYAEDMKLLNKETDDETKSQAKKALEEQVKALTAQFEAGKVNIKQYADGMKNLDDQQKKLEGGSEDAAEKLKIYDEVMKDLHADTEKTAKVQDVLNQLVATGTITSKQASKELKKLTTDGKDGFKDLEQAINNFGSGFEDAIANMVKTGKLNFKDLFDSLISDITKLIIKLEIINPLINSLTGSHLTTGLGGLFGGLLGGAFNSSAISSAGLRAGSFIANPGNIGLRASGGPVTAGMPYIVGEKGPELMIPNMSGSIVPNHALGGGGLNVTHQWTIVANDTRGFDDLIAQRMPWIMNQSAAHIEKLYNRKGRFGPLNAQRA